MSTSKSPSYFAKAYRDYRLQNPDRKLDHYLEAIEQRTSRPRALLDIGCGLGAFLGGARQRNPEWTLAGTDIDTEAVQATRDLIPDAVIRHSGATEAAFLPSSFDLVTAWDVLEHVQDINGARTAIHEMLRPGGLFAFVVPVYDGITGPLIRALDKDKTHIHTESRWFWLDWVGESFEHVQWHGVFRYLLGDWYLHFPTAAFRRHSPAILVTATRR